MYIIWMTHMILCTYVASTNDEQKGTSLFTLISLVPFFIARLLECGRHLEGNGSVRSLTRPEKIT